MLFTENKPSSFFDSYNGYVVCRFPFDGNIKDVSKNNVPAQWVGNELYCDAKIGQGVKLNGENYIKIPGGTDTHQQGEQTVAFWFKQDCYNDGNYAVVTIGNSNDSKIAIRPISTTEDNKLVIHTGKKNVFVSDRQIFEIGKFYHLTITFNVYRNVFDVYVNGAKIKGTSNVSVIQEMPLNEIYIGIESGGGVNFCGIVDEFCYIFDYLSEENVFKLYKDRITNLPQQKQLVYEEEIKRLAECSVANVEIKRQENIEVKFNEEYNLNPLYIKPIILLEFNGNTINTINGENVSSNSDLIFEENNNFKFLKKGSSALNLGKVNSNGISLMMRIKEADDGRLFSLEKTVNIKPDTFKAEIETVDENYYTVNITLPNNQVVKSVQLKKENGFQNLFFVINSDSSNTYIKAYYNDKIILFAIVKSSIFIVNDNTMYIGNHWFKNSLTFDVDCIYLFDKVIYKNQVKILNANFIKRKPVNGLKDYSYAVLESNGKILDEIYTLSNKKITNGKSVPCFYIKPDGMFFNGNTFTAEIENGKNKRNGFYLLDNISFPCDDIYNDRDDSIIVNENILSILEDAGVGVETAYMPYEFIIAGNNLYEDFTKVNYLKDLIDGQPSETVSGALLLGFVSYRAEKLYVNVDEQVDDENYCKIQPDDKNLYLLYQFGLNDDNSIIVAIGNKTEVSKVVSNIVKYTFGKGSGSSISYTETKESFDSKWKTEGNKRPIWDGCCAFHTDPSIGDRQSSGVSAHFDFVKTIEFDMKVSSEYRYDYMRFYLNGVQKVYISGTTNWNHYSYEVNGPADIKFLYTKDGSVTRGDDCGYVKNLKIIGAAGLLGFPYKEDKEVS